jgi:hypothetical protein
MRSPSPSFSKRHGYSNYKEINIREDAPQDLRSPFLVATRSIARAHLGEYPEKNIRTVIATALNKWVGPDVWHYEAVWKQVESLVYECDWLRVYELMESVNAYFEKTSPIAAMEFAQRLNDVFIEQGIGWQIVNGERDEGGRGI